MTICFSRWLSPVVAAAILCTGAASRLAGQDVDLNSNRSSTPQATISPADWDAIRRSAESYADAFNKGDAVVIAGLYTENAELVDAGGNAIQGRPAIQKEYLAFFQAHPDATIQIVVDNVRSVAPGIITEEGRAQTRLDEDVPVVVTRYTAVHAKHGDTWRLVSVRDFDLQPSDPGARLEQLAWLIGQWVDEDVVSLLEIDCYWHESGAYLIRDFKVRVKGLLAASGTERIGWDPLRRQVRSWLFDSKGGHLEAAWVRDGDDWTVTASGFRADGKPLQATYLVTPLRRDAYHMRSFNRFAGETQLDDLDMTVVRRPPEATNEGDRSADPPPEKADLN